jgi:prepilin-type N-terminal cleavage/methylation domain-containing protein/prepilin-type processing-associated H-X9-DG protein
MRDTRPSQRGFSLIELLATLTIIGILVAFLLPAIQYSRETARMVRCANNLKQIGVALHEYHMLHYTFPPGAITWQESPRDYTTPRRGHSLFTMILPEIGQATAYNAINFAFASIGMQGSQNAGAINYTALSNPIATLICPSDSGQHGRPCNPGNSALPCNAYTQCSYAAMVGTYDIFRWSCCFPNPCRDKVACFGGSELKPDGPFGNNFGARIPEFKDGLGNTLLVGEFARFRNDPDQVFNEWTSAIYYRSAEPGVTRPQGLATAVPRINAPLSIPDVPAGPPRGGCVIWKYNPRNRDFGQFGFRSRHAGGAHFLFGDGSVKFLKESIIPKVYEALSTRADQDIIDGGSL